jgi:hypothetical protein
MIARLSVLLVLTLLALPGVAALSGLNPDPASGENRVLAPAPDWPRSWQALSKAPGQADAWMRDHFAFRSAMVRANSQLRFALFHETPTRQTLFGHDGRLFLTAHDADHPYSLIKTICGVGVSAADITTAAEGIETLLRAAGPNAIFVAVPTAPTLYTSDLPDWLRRQCQTEPTAEQVVERTASARAIYPVAALRAAMTSGPVIPRYNFHWSGRGARAVAAMVAKQVMGLKHAVDIPAIEQMADSDLARMVPGLTLQDTVMLPDTAAAGIDFCYARPECLPGLGDITAVVDDYSRTVSPRAGPGRLLLISDSYGSFIAPWLGAYFGEVRHISSNNFDRLSPAQRVRLMQSLFTDYRPDRIIFLYHDGAITYAPRRTAGQLWPTSVVASVR